MNHPHLRQQLALDRQRELVAHSDRHRLAKQLKLARRDDRPRRTLYRLVWGVFSKLASANVHAGRTTVVVQTDTHRDDGKLATRTTRTQAVLTP